MTSYFKKLQFRQLWKKIFLRYTAPVAYLPFALACASDGIWPTPTYIEYDSSKKTLSTTSPVSPDKIVRFKFQPNGYNNLPNPRGLSVANFGEPHNAHYEEFNVADSEWFGVMLINAKHNGDGKTNIATGGNHGSSGGAGGAKTARNIKYDVYSNNKILDTDYAGYVDGLTINVVNELMASDTISLGRFVLRQEYWISISGNAIGVHAKYTALEDIVIKRDRALQLNTQGYRDSALFLDGNVRGRTRWDSVTSNSGPRNSSPNAWAALLKGKYGVLGVWMDRSFGAATELSTVAEDAPLIHGPGNTKSHKLYNAIVYKSQRMLAAGESYEWRGGYSWSGTEPPPQNIDSVLHKLINKTTETILVFPDGRSKLVTK